MIGPIALPAISTATVVAVGVGGILVFVPNLSIAEDDEIPAVFSKKDKSGKNQPVPPAGALNQNEASVVPTGGGGRNTNQDDDDKQKKGKPKRNTDQNK